MSKPRTAFTLVELLVVVAIIGLLIALLLPAVQMAREAARRTECKNQLRQVGLALHMYHDNTRRLPSGWVAGAAWKDPGWGWSAAILPYIEQENAFDRIRFEMPIDEDINSWTLAYRIPLYQCPSDPTPEVFTLRRFPAYRHPPPWPSLEVARSNYSGMFGTGEIDDGPSNGNGTLFHNSRIRFAQIHDGLGNTIIVGERSSTLGAAVWHGKIFSATFAMARIVGSADHVPNSLHAHFDDFGSHHPHGAHFLMGDGSVRHLDDSIELELYEALATRAGNEIALENTRR